VLAVGRNRLHFKPRSQHIGVEGLFPSSMPASPSINSSREIFTKWSFAGEKVTSTIFQPFKLAR
jgi:hypothetical protein